MPQQHSHYFILSPFGLTFLTGYRQIWRCQFFLKADVANNINAVELLSLRDPGPWGGPGGNQWDDGVFAAVQKVHLYIGYGWIHAIQVEYLKRDGKNIWSPMHGTPIGELIEMNFAGEVLVGIEGHCGPVEGENGVGVTITSISLYTNRGKYGPFEEEIQMRGADRILFQGSLGRWLDSLARVRPI
ncbi:agglutinin-like [Rhododendron vialii]|uniref:agglutinin-like n=1 Tax=Rhododendron vialii TaxID=182163 RepID=UPI00265D6589|nr:agglutinin-like [Rhododendron vialii]